MPASFFAARVDSRTFTASKFIKESTATVAALLSALLASRRNRVLSICIRHALRHCNSIYQYLPPRSGTYCKPRICNHRCSNNCSKIPSKFIRLTYLVVRTNWGRMIVYHLTKIPQTMDISRAVGTIRNNTACNMNVIPLIWN